jgi:hypothetical protein
MHAIPLVLLITVRLYDTFGVPPLELRTAMNAAETALRAASVQPAWVVCPSHAVTAETPSWNALGSEIGRIHDRASDNSTGCTGIPGPEHLIVRIVDAPRGPDRGDILGYASVDTVLHHGILATIYGGRIHALAAEARVDRGILLGHAIAHEVGHLLLGTTAHARRGLMRPRWSLKELQQRAGADWRFSSGEGKAMVSAAQAYGAQARALPPPVLLDRSVSQDASGNLRGARASDPPSERMPSTPPPAPCSLAAAAVLPSR